MNLPNKLTIFRMILILPFIVVMMVFKFDKGSDYSYWFLVSALLIFVVAMLTDFLDGYIARKNKIVTSFGKFFDPIADKIMINSALISFVIVFSTNIFIPIVILFITRDVIVDGSRNLAAKNGIEVAASIWGKLKTVLQTLSIIIILVFFSIVYSDHEEFKGFQELHWLSQIILIPLYLALISSLCSGFNYVYKIKSYIKIK